MIRALLLALVLMLFGCQNECEKVGKDESCTIVGTHTYTYFVMVGKVMVPMTGVMNDYSCVCVERAE
jgi:hypothetical protein